MTDEQIIQAWRSANDYGDDKRNAIALGRKIEEAVDAEYGDHIAELEAVIVQAREALAWVIEQGGGPICEHEAGVCFCKENAAISAIDALNEAA